MQIQPSLATSWDTPDPSTWVFHLRDGATFHNGDPVDAAAVKFSLDRFLDPTTKAAQASLMRPIKNVDVMDPHTVRFTTDGPYAGLLDVLATYFFVVSPSVKGQDANKVVIGSGAYQFVEWKPGERLVIKANPGYWGQKAKLEQVTLRPISEAAARLVELHAGSADLISPVPPLQYSQVGGHRRDARQSRGREHHDHVQRGPGAVRQRQGASGVQLRGRQASHHQWCPARGRLRGGLATEIGHAGL